MRSDYGDRTEEMRAKTNFLEKNQAKSIRPGHHPVTIEVVGGTAYITKEGDAADYVLKSGDTIEVDGRGTTVIQGLPHVAYRLCA